MAAIQSLFTRHLATLPKSVLTSQARCMDGGHRRGGAIGLRFGGGCSGELRGRSVGEIEGPGRLCLGFIAETGPAFNLVCRQMDAVKRELDQEYDDRNGVKTKPSADADHGKISSTSRT